VGLDGLIHLTTRQYATDRRAIIAEVRRRLDPADPKPCRVVATSLVEAGVDLDFPRVWRAEAGLDSVIQAAGRCNREGRRPLEESVVTVFSAPCNPAPRQVQALADAMQSVAAKRDDLLSPEAIRDWFEEVYWRIGPERLDRKGIVDKLPVTAASGSDFAFREIAALYRMIESPMLPVIVAREDEAASWVAKLAVEQVPSGAIARALQSFTVQVPSQARDLLVANGHARFRNPQLRGDQFCVLETGSLYREGSGLWWEDAEYLAAEATVI
jgi:CRISPR-associated endonuclease/helicase Cas3